MNPKLTAVFIAVLAVIMFGRQFFHQVPAGHVGVATFFGEVQDFPYPEGPHFPVNPLFTWYDMDVREKSTKLPGIEVPTRDQLLTKIDLSVQYRLNGKMAPICRSSVHPRQRKVVFTGALSRIFPAL